MIADYWKIVRKFVRGFGFSTRFYYGMFFLSFLFVIGFTITPFFIIAKLLLWAFLVVFIIDLVLLYREAKGIVASRNLPKRLSNGDDNTITIHLNNNYAYNILARVIDEIPPQFQLRNNTIVENLKANSKKVLSYTLTPKTRGEYNFGRVLVYAKSRIGLVERRFISDANCNVSVYPSFIQMQQYQLMAVSNRLVESGIKPIRKIGHHNEFDQIRNYIKGDDIRTINWKATARKSELMVNQYREEKAQPIYAIIDKGRNMKSPFAGMTLLDYAINASLVFSNIALLKDDKAGILTFSKSVDSFLPASKRSMQMEAILEVLYNQQTNFEEPNFELLYSKIRNNITHRSLLVLFTNFESSVSLSRQLKYLKAIARHHLLLVVFFKNTELNKLTSTKPVSTRDIYEQAIAEHMVYEKIKIEKELNQNGILTILTSPRNLTINLINEYLRIKARALI